MKTGPVSCPEISVRNYHYSLSKYPKERSSHILRDGNLTSRKSKLAVNQHNVVDITVKDSWFESKRVHICALLFYLRSTIIVLGQMSYKEESVLGSGPNATRFEYACDDNYYFFLTVIYNQILYGICGRQEGKRRWSE